MKVSSNKEFIKGGKWNNHTHIMCVQNAAFPQAWNRKEDADLTNIGLKILRFSKNKKKP